MGTSPKALSTKKPSHDSGSPVLERESLLVAASYSGPIPDPEMLRAYDRVSPGLAMRLVANAEAEAAHRRSLETAALRAEIEDRTRTSHERLRGQVCACVITLAALAAGAYTALQGHELAGSVLGGIGICPIVTTFILGRQARATP
ncbi:MAG: DUF2335 domain-containing protein [Bryobacteraceae bacterium]|nr:DUF2335 domain-containing protein [Bryobacteraceae bacterium]